MIETGFDKRVKVQQIIDNQLPDFLLSESPKVSEFLKQYYISQEYQGGPIDIADNLDQYLKLDNLTPEVINGYTTLTSGITTSSNTIFVSSTKGFPDEYGLLKIDNEIITYTGITTNSFTGCIRGFSGITSYRNLLNPSELTFSTSDATDHSSGSSIQNLSALFLQEFYKKIKYSLSPGLENVSFTSNLDVSNFIKESRSFYASKGTEESFKILFKVLYGENIQVLDLEKYLIKPSSAKFLRRQVIVAEKISGDPSNLIGQTIKSSEIPTAQGSVSEVEIISRSGKTYYKIYLFIGYDESNLTEGEFRITPKTKVIDNVDVGSSIITVDSTIGFGNSGILVSGNNVISYSDKSINQFFNCSNVTTQISKADTIRSNEIVFGYENGDTSKKVELLITGVLSEFYGPDVKGVSEGEKISVKNLGKVIENPSSNKSYTEIFSNSWIYNTSSRYYISSFSGSTLTLLSKIDKSSLKVGDNVEIVIRGTQNVVATNAVVQSINLSSNQITLSNLLGFSPSVSLDYDLRRNVNKANSNGAPIRYGNDKIISDIQNLYVDDDEKYAYVASNSLPSYTLEKNIVYSEIPEATGVKLESSTSGFLQGFSSTTLKFSTISFQDNTKFVTGDRVIYSPSNEEIPGLKKGFSYFVEVLGSGNKIRLYESRSFINSDFYIEFDSLEPGSGSHQFILYKHRSGYIGPQKTLKKFNLNPNYQSGGNDKTLVGGIGMLINGVEIVSPKTDDRIYYGPLSQVRVINGGRNYDVTNPPYINISVGSGTTALVQPVISGNINRVYVEPQEFDIGVVVSASVKGGNGSGAILKPYIARRYRELEFDARQTTLGGGVNIANETITFNKNHNLKDGDAVVYNNNDNDSLGISTYLGSNAYYKTLSNGATYYVKTVGLTTVRLYQTFSDSFSGINTVGFTTENTSGIHKFATFEKDTLRSINVISSGSGYQNRKLYVKGSGISTTFNLITFNNHNFNDGDIVRYETTESNVGGLSTANSYYVIKYDNNSFRLADAGIGATITGNYLRNNYVKLTSTGSGYHIFKYPDIEVVVNVSYGNTFVGIVTATPVVKGEIIDAYLYESGSGYGTTIVNFEKKPIITIKNGKNAEIKPIIKNGKIQSIEVFTSGSEYYSIPDIEIIGDGTGAILKANIVEQKLISVTVINGGSGYTQENTTCLVKASGSGAILDSNIRSLQINQQFEKETEVLVETLDDLKYAFVGYSTNIFSENYDDDGSEHSPIIGWAYDGNPIYGPYGFSNPEDISSTITLMKSGYSASSSIVDRPSSFGLGYFIEDYKFTNSGTLDIHNGRFCKTPEFPKGVYAYFVGVDTSISTGTLIPQYPYFVGETYKSEYSEENLTLDQYFDFNSSNLARNTLAYKVNDPYANNDFFIESNEVVKQLSVVESVSKGGITGFEILNEGDGYKVGDSLNFDDTGTNGSGLNADVSSITGKDIVDINTSIETFNNTVFTWKDSNTVLGLISPSHTFLNNDSILVSGLSSSITNLTKVHQIGVTTEKCVLFKNMSAVGISTVEDIYVSRIPISVSVGSSLNIGSETVSVLNRFDINSIIRVKRTSGIAHTATTEVNVSPNTFTIPINVEYFDSKVNNKVYFNPKQSVGIGTTAGVGISTTYTIGEFNKTISIPTQSIYLPSHPFKTGEQLTFSKTSSATALIVSNSPTSSTFNLPQSGNTQTVYVINKSKDYIGLTTSVGLTTNTDGLYFSSNGSNDFEYSLSTNYTQVTGKSQKVTAVVSVSTAHGMNNGDVIRLNVKPNTTVGFGTENEIRVKYNSLIDKFVFNSIGFTSASINTSNSTISIGASHLNTGDKVFYTSSDSIASGLTSSTYFIYKIDDNTIKLSETLKDTEGQYPVTVPIIGIGGSQHQIQLINPPVIIKNDCNLKFNLSDTSLNGYKLKLFFDSEFNNEFVSVANTTSFNLIGIGTVGVGTTASLTLRHSNSLPNNLFYAFEKSGFISTADKEVRNYSQIIFVDSEYNGTYSVSGVGSTTFSISLSKVPNETNLTPSNTNILEYSTTSTTASGGVKKIRTIFGGSNYKSLPGFSSITSLNGQNANIIAISDQVGKINKVRILDQGFEYSSDKTLRPDAYISPTYYLSNSNTIESVNVISGGKNYSTPPNLLIVDPETYEVVSNTDSALSCNLNGTAISSVDVVYPPKGLSSSQQNIIAVNNSNGIGINTIISSPSGIITCFLTTPLTGFSTAVFSTGDEIFVENIQKNDLTGTGFNSSDYGYRFFTITNFVNSNPAKLEYSVAGLTTNAGLAKTSQNSYAFIVNKTNYPIFEPVQAFSEFLLDEIILVKSSTGTEFIETDLTVQIFDRDYLKFIGTYTQIKIGDTIKGKKSGTVALISDIDDKKSKFKVDYSIKKDSGWLTDTGKLNDFSQVSSDNDYYQNMAYSIKSTVQYDDMVNSVNRLLHPSGMKNFSDTQIKSRGSRVSVASSTNDVIVIDLVEEARVDTVNNFDLTLDVDTLSTKSKFVKFKNKKLTDYVKCSSNRVLLVDDISSSFQNTNANLNNYVYMDFIEDSFYKYIYQISDINSSTKQIGEIIALYTNNNVYNLSKSLIASGLGTSTETNIGEVVADMDSFDVASLRFIPTDSYNKDYDIKVLKTSFSSDLPGIGTQSLGFVNLVGVNTTVGIGTTVTIFSELTSKNKGIFANIQVINNVTKQMNYVELYVDHDGTDTYTSEFYFDTTSGVTTNHIGIFQPTISSGSFKLNYYNNISNDVFIRSKIVGFGTTSVGVGTYRFLSSGQISGNERSAYYQSNYNVSSGSTSVIGVSSENVSTVKSTIKVSYGNTSSLHQVIMCNSNGDTIISQYPFLSIGSTNGIGTFGGSVVGKNVILSFYPDSYVGSNVLVQSFNEILYSINDNDNEAPVLNYGTVEDSLVLSQYSGLNGSRINRKSFVLKYDDTPIFSKTFDPSSSSILNPSTGVFQINNHFFSNKEKLVYTPESTLIGVAATSLGIGSTATQILGGVGIGTTDILPSTVYVIKIDNNNFKLATTPEYATSGIGVTFTSLGSGNSHRLTMSKRNEKTIITLDGVIQKPLTFTPLSYNLTNNGGQIGTASTIFSLSGISSIRPKDLIKIDSEYMDVISVGLGTTSVGPITGIGSFNLVSVSRSSVGSSLTSHTDGTSARVYRGSYNIENSTIYFTNPPYGNAGILKNPSTQLPYDRSSFDGRVYLRKDYSTNYIFDDISDSFSGIGVTYNLTVQGINTSGVNTTSILLINDIFQTPTTLNNVGNNYEIIPSPSAGISTISFTGITSSNNQLIISEYDINQNQLPRGGIIISLGSTSGLGFAPLVGASVTAVVGAGGSIVSVGLGTTDRVGSGYYGTVSIGLSETSHSVGFGSTAIILATVGAGGTLSFTVSYGGTGYTNPKVVIPEPSYSNLPVIGVSRFGIGSTTTTGSNLLLSLDVGASSTTGIGSTLFEVKSFKISRPGYGFRIGDVFKPVGLVTAKGLVSPVFNFELTVLDVFTDSFASWQFGDLDFIDPIAPLQDGTRKRFPLYYNAQLVSFEIDSLDPDSVEVDLNTILLVFRNGILQKPGESYEYDGGTSILFLEAPRQEDKISIFFYKGTTGVDIENVNVTETIKIGDDIKINKNNNYPETIDQENRRVDDISGSDKIETNIYSGPGIDINNYKPLFWSKQKVDKIINGDLVYKSRDSIESQVYPTAKVIKNVSSSDTQIFVDDIQLFDYEKDVSSTSISNFSVFLSQDSGSVSAALTATVSAAGTISSLTITNVGSGYTGSSLSVKIAAPKSLGIGIGTTATATVLISNGGISSPTILNPGFGYDQSSPPNVIVETPQSKIETLTGASDTKIMGFSGIITGITTSSGTSGHPLALNLFVNSTFSATPFTDLLVGYPILVFETGVGTGVTSVDSENSSIVGIGTSFLNNIYYVHSISASGQNAQIVTNIHSQTSVVGLATTSISSLVPVGKFSWGRVFNITRSSSPVSIGVTGLVVDSGLSTFPTIQRRAYGLRDNGSLKKTFG